MKRALELLRVYGKVTEDEYAKLVIYVDGSGHVEASGHDGVEISGTSFVESNIEQVLMELIVRTVDK